MEAPVLDPPAQQDPFAALGATYEDQAPAKSQDPFAGLGAQYEDAPAEPVHPVAPVPPSGPMADAQRLAQTNAQISQQLPNGTLSAAPNKPGLWDRIRNSAVGHAIQTEFPGAPDWLKPTDVPGTPEYQENAQTTPRILPEWASKPLVSDTGDTSDHETQSAKDLEKKWNSFRNQHPTVAAVLNPVGSEADWEKNHPNVAAARGAVDDFAKGMTSPEGIATLGAGLFGKLGKVNDILNGVFATQAAQGTYESAREAEKQYKAGNNPGATAAATTALLNAAMGASMVHHAASGGTHAEAPEEKPAEPATTDKVSDPFAELGAQYENSGEVPRGTPAEHPPIGEIEPETGRPVLQQSPRPEVNQAAATAEHPAVKDQLEEAVKPIEGAQIAGAREEKDPERVEEKIEEGQSPRTVRDFSGFRVSVDSPAARDQVVDQLRKRFEVVDEQDEFEKGNEETGFHGHTLQVREPGSPVSHEVQVLPREVAESADDRHGLYEKARAGDEDAAAQMKAANEADWQKFVERSAQGAHPEYDAMARERGPDGLTNMERAMKRAETDKSRPPEGFLPHTESERDAIETMTGEPYDEAKHGHYLRRTYGGQPVDEKPKFKFGSTQANIPEDSEAAAALKTAQYKINPSDLAGTDVNGTMGGLETQPHVTVRYGIRGDDVEGIKKYLSQQAPFEASLGKTDTFPPSEHSDGAAPIIAPIDAPELHRIEAELEQHGDFEDRSFPEYKPHATLGYVKPEAAAKYVGMGETEGKKFLVNSISISDRNGNLTEVPLKGEPNAGSEPGAASVHQRPPQENGVAGDGRGRVEPGLEGQGSAGAREEEAARPAGEVAPNTVARVPVADLKADPRRFQYKMNTDAAGTTDLLKGRKWNDALAGVISVWRDPSDGQAYVVNGHHRFELASSSGVEHMNVLTLDAPDAETARSIGALQNIAEGRGTPVDAAKFFRDSGYTPEDLDKIGVSMGEATAANGIALARLDDRLFDDVVAGKLRQNRAIAIGNATDVPEEQDAILKLIEKAEARGRKVSDDTVDELARMAKSAGTHTDRQESLFGTQEMTRNLALEKAEVSSYIREQIGKEKRLFGSVADEGKAGRLAEGGNKINAAKNRQIAESAAQAQELYDRLSTKAGTVDEILSRSAQALARGEAPAAVKQRSYDEVRRALSETLREPKGSESEGIRAGAGGGEETLPAAAQRSQGLRAPTPPERGPKLEKWEKGERFLVRDPATGDFRSGEVTYFNEGNQPQAKAGGRSRLSDGTRLDEIPHDALRIRAGDKPIKPISGTDFEREIIDRTKQNLPKYVGDYLERFSQGGVPTLATDAAKELYPEFKADPTGADRETAAGGKAIRDAALKTVLAAPVDPKRPDVLITTASPGSGKTFTQSGGNPDAIGAKIEAISDDFKSFRGLVQQVIDSGRQPVVQWIYVDDPAKTVRRMFLRALGHGEKPGIGRTVQLKYMADAYTQVPRVLEQIRDEFGDKVQIHAVDNSGPLGTAKVTSDIEPLIESIKAKPYNQVVEEMADETRKLQSEGVFASDRGKAILKAAEARDPTGSDEAGKRSGQVSEGRGSGGGESQRPEVAGSLLKPAKSEIETAGQSAGGSVSAEEFKAGLEQARKRSLRENAAAQQARAITTDHGKAVLMDPDAMALWYRSGLGERTAWRGLSLPKALANKVELVLRSMAGSARTEAGGQDAAAGYDRLAKAIKDGRNDDGSATLLRGDYRDDTVREEAWHNWQSQNRIQDSDAMRMVAQRSEVKEIADRLRDLGYGVKPGIEGRTELAMEMMAKALSGDPDLKISAEQRYDLTHSFLSEAVREFGPQILNDIPGVTPEAEAALADARRTYEPDEAGRGSAPRGQGARPGEGLEERPGLEEGARNGGGRPAPRGDERGAPGAGEAQDQLSFQRAPAPGDINVSRAQDSEEGPGWKTLFANRYTQDSPEQVRKLWGYDKPGMTEPYWSAAGRMIISPEKDGSWAVRLVQSLNEKKGTATALYEKAIEYARSQGATELTSDPEGGSKDSVAGIWKKLGAVETPGVGEKPGAVRWRLDISKDQPSYQRARRGVRPEDSLTLPGMEAADQERGAARAEAEGQELTDAMRRPMGDISKAAGEMERSSPLFRGTGDNQLLFQRDEEGNPVARRVQDLIDELAKEPQDDKRSALEKVADFTGRTLDESTGRSAQTLRELPSKLQNAWMQAKLVTAALVDGFRRPLKATEWKQSVGQMDLARAQTALKLRALGEAVKDAAPDKLARIGMTHFIEAGGDPRKLDEWSVMAAERWKMRRGDPNIDPRLKNHLAESVEHYKAATELTPQQEGVAMKIKQHLDDMLQLAKDNGLLEYGARNYVRHLYETADAADLIKLLDTNELNPNPGFIEKRIFRTYWEAENAGMIPRNKDLGYLVTAYDKSFNQALASRGMMRSLLDGRGQDGRPLAAIRLRGKWVTVDDAHQPLVLEQRERPNSLAGYKYLEHAPTRNFLFEPTREDLDGYEFDPKLFEEDPARLAFKGDLIFHPEVANRIDDMLSPGWFDRNENVAQKIGHKILAGSSVAKEMMTILAPFHLVQLGEHSIEHWVNPLKLPELDLNSKSENSRRQQLLASNGLGLMDFDAEGLFSAKTLKGLADGIPGVNVAMDAVNSLSRWQFEDVIPRMKMKMAMQAFDRNWEKYGSRLEAEELGRARGNPDAEKIAHERAERMVAELTAKQANAAFGNLNTAFDSIHRSKTFKQLLRLTLFAPDFLESRIRYTGQAFTRYGGEQRAALARGALGMYVIARVANALLNKGDTKNDLEHAFTVVANGRNFSLRSQAGDILHLITDPRGFIYNRINPLTVRPIVEYLNGRDQFGRQKSGASQVKDIAKSVLPFGVQKVIQTPDESWLNSILSSAGVVTSNYRSPAEEMTHKLYLRSIPDLPDDPEKQAQNRNMHQLEEDVREGKKKPADAVQLAKDGKITMRQAWNIVDRAGHSKLYNEFVSGGVSIVPKTAGDPSALDIYAAASPAERMELRPALIEKGENQLPDIRRQAPAPRADIRALEKQWEEQAKVDPNFKPPAKVPETQFEVLAALWRSLLASTPHEKGVPEAPPATREAVAAK